MFFLLVMARNVHALDDTQRQQFNGALRDGKNYIKQKKYREAIDEFNRAIRLSPDSAVAYHGRGVAHQNNGDLNQAIDDFGKVIEINPQQPPLFYPEYPYLASAYHYRGNAYLQKSEFDLAIADFNRALELQPNSVEDYYARGKAHSSKKQTDLASKDFDRAWSLMEKGVPRGRLPSRNFFDKVKKAAGKKISYENFVAKKKI